MKRGGFVLNAGNDREWLQFRFRTGMHEWKAVETGGIHAGNRCGCIDDLAQKGGVS